MTTERTTTEHELRELVFAGVTHGEIAERLGCARSSVAVACALLGIKALPGVRRKTQSRHEAAQGLHAALFSISRGACE